LTIAQTFLQKGNSHAWIGRYIPDHRHRGGSLRLWRHCQFGGGDRANPLLPVPGSLCEKGPLAYLGRRVLEMAALAPLRVTGTQRKFDITIKVIGGGTSGQAGAIAHGIARALCRYDPDLRAALKKAGLLTRDARMKERKKYGLKRARKAPQYTKR